MTKDKLLQEVIDFMLSETEKHDKSWKGRTTEEWMVAFAKEQRGGNNDLLEVR